MAIKLIFPQTCPRSSGGMVPPQRQMQEHPHSLTADFKKLFECVIIRQLDYFLKCVRCPATWMTNVNIPRPFLRTFLVSFMLSPLAEIWDSVCVCVSKVGGQPL